MSIPKIIHYCWFGGNPKSDLIKKCIRSWEKYCPDYEIIEWNESNFDLEICSYVKEAYEAKKWAFVTDYVRIWALYNYGGVYLDTDCEITKKIDVFLHHSAFTGFENTTHPFTAVFAAEKHHPLTKGIIESYSVRHFINEDGSYDITTNTDYITGIFIKKYQVKLDNSLQVFDDGLAIYPNDYFCPKDWIDGKIYKTKNTYAIHHFNASWHTDKEKAEAQKYKKHRAELKKQEKKQNIRHFIRTIPNRILMKLLGKKKYAQLKAKLKR